MTAKYPYYKEYEEHTLPEDEQEHSPWFSVGGDIDDFIFYDDEEKLYSER